MFIFKKGLFKNRNGSILLITILILTAVLTIALGTASLIASGLLMSRTQIHSTKAYFAAETGAERLLWNVRKNSFDPTDSATNCNPVTSKYVNFNLTPVQCQGAPIDYSLSNGAKYYVIYIADLPDVIFQSIGSFQGVRRSVEVKY